MSASYTVGSFANDYSGAILPHPDQPSQSGVNLPVSIDSTFTTMAQVHGTMTNMAFRELPGLDADVVIYRTGPTYLLSAFRSFPIQRLFSSFVPREIPDGSGGVALEFVNRSSSRCLTLEQVLEAVGFISTGLFTNAFNTSAEISAANVTLNNTLKAYMTISRVV